MSRVAARALGVSLLVAALLCGVVAFVERDSIEVLRAEPAYLDKSAGEKPQASGYTALSPASGDQFSPFRVEQAYLWLGLAIGSGLAGVVVLLLARRHER